MVTEPTVYKNQNFLIRLNKVSTKIIYFLVMATVVFFYFFIGLYSKNEIFYSSSDFAVYRFIVTLIAGVSVMMGLAMFYILIQHVIRFFIYSESFFKKMGFFSFFTILFFLVSVGISFFFLRAKYEVDSMEVFLTNFFCCLFISDVILLIGCFFIIFMNKKYGINYKND